MQLGGVAIEILWGRKVWLMWVFLFFGLLVGWDFIIAFAALPPANLMSSCTRARSFI